jgi:hypothetical protein
MAKEVETRSGACPACWNVDATREIPKMGFPFIYFSVARAMARRRSFRCPECGQPVTVLRERPSVKGRSLLVVFGRFTRPRRPG